MTEPTDSAPPTRGGPGGKLKAFIKKNKTLSIVIAAVGGYFAWHELNKPQEGGGVEPVSSTEEPVSGSALGPEANPDVSHEAIDEEIRRIEQEVREENEDRVRAEEQNENKGEGGGSGETNPGEPGATTETDNSTPESPVNTAPSVTLHGRTFAGATGSHISGTGQSNGGKAWIEYTITYPGRQEHWRYFTASGNWSQVKNSATGPGANKGSGGKTATPPPKNSGNNNNGQAGSGKAGGGGNGTPNNPAPKQGIGNNVVVKKPPKQHQGVGQARPVGGGGGGSTSPAAPAPAPSQAVGCQQQHPNAVFMNLGSGHPKPNAPNGWHVFECNGGWWRAPN